MVGKSQTFYGGYGWENRGIYCHFLMRELLSGSALPRSLGIFFRTSTNPHDVTAPAIIGLRLVHLQKTTSLGKTNPFRYNQ